MKSYLPDRSLIVVTLYSLFVGALGAALAYWLSFPFYILTGPAILVSFLSITGIRFAITDVVRDAALLFIGIGIGSGLNAGATAAFLRWPLAFLALTVMLLAIMLVCRFVLTRYFQFDPRSAILAATPGHLSFVLSMSAELDLDVARVAGVKSVRLLALTLLVSFVAVAFGVKVDGTILPPGLPIPTVQLVILLAASLGFGLILKRFRVPAPLLLGGLIVSSLTHLIDITSGTLLPEIALSCFLVLGTMIGTRFCGVALSQLKQAVIAGLVITGVAVVMAILAALSVAAFVGMPVAHVVVAFAPGGLETMVAMGVILGANPGFIVACHIARLLVLSLLVPLFIGRHSKSPV